MAPEYASTGMLNERSDVYSFGILIMEVISGRNPVDYSRPPEEVCTKFLPSFISGSFKLSMKVSSFYFCSVESINIQEFCRLT